MFAFLQHHAMPMYSCNAIVTIFSLFSISHCYRNEDRRLASQKLDSVLKKYVVAVKRLTNEFPNHQIELHLDIAGQDRSKPLRRVNYIHLREPAYLTGRTEAINKSEVNYSSNPGPLSNDPEMQPVLMKDLKRVVNELDRKYGRQIEAAKIPQKPIVDANMKPILQLLEKGTLVDREVPKPPEDNMSWLQIKIPK